MCCRTRRQLDVGVARVHIDAPRAVGCGRNLGFDLAFVVDDPGVQGEVPKRVPDVVFGIAAVVAFQDFVEVLDRGVVAIIECRGLRLGGGQWGYLGCASCGGKFYFRSVLVGFELGWGGFLRMGGMGGGGGYTPSALAPNPRPAPPLGRGGV